MRQDLITPYNVLFCGCLAYTPVPVCRLGNTANTPMALFSSPIPPAARLTPLIPTFPLRLLVRCSFSYSSVLRLFLSRPFSPLVVLVFVVSKCRWFVCTCHKACSQPLPPVRSSTSHPPSGACVLLYALLYESHTFAKGIRELILI